jgi:hypothetical protein
MAILAIQNKKDQNSRKDSNSPLKIVTFLLLISNILLLKTGDFTRNYSKKTKQKSMPSKEKEEIFEGSEEFPVKNAQGTFEESHESYNKEGNIYYNGGDLDNDDIERFIREGHANPNIVPARNITVKSVPTHFFPKIMNQREKEIKSHQSHIINIDSETESPKSGTSVASFHLLNPNLTTIMTPLTLEKILSEITENNLIGTPRFASPREEDENLLPLPSDLHLEVPENQIQDLNMSFSPSKYNSIEDKKVNSEDLHEEKKLASENQKENVIPLKCPSIHVTSEENNKFVLSNKTEIIPQNFINQIGIKINKTVNNVKNRLKTMDQNID